MKTEDLENLHNLIRSIHLLSQLDTSKLDELKAGKIRKITDVLIDRLGTQVMSKEAYMFFCECLERKLTRNERPDPTEDEQRSA